jgi:hypothetical protein
VEEREREACSLEGSSAPWFPLKFTCVACLIWRTPLVFCARFGAPLEVWKLLVASGADPNLFHDLTAAARAFIAQKKDLTSGSDWRGPIDRRLFDAWSIPSTSRMSCIPTERGRASRYVSSFAVEAWFAQEGEPVLATRVHGYVGHLHICASYQRYLSSLCGGDERSVQSVEMSK